MFSKVGRVLVSIVVIAIVLLGVILDVEFTMSMKFLIAITCAAVVIDWCDR